MPLNPRNFEACINEIAQTGKVGPKTALDILEQVADRAEQMRQTGVQDPLVQAAGELASKYTENAKRKQLDALRNAAIRNKWTTEAAAAGPTGAAGYLRSKLYWTPGGAKDNIQTMGKAITERWLSTFDAALRKEGLLDAARDPAMFDKIAKELYEVHNVQGPKKPSAIKDPTKRIAEIIAPLQNELRDRFNAEGAMIGQGTDYIAHSSHDIFWMRRGGRGMDKAPSANEAAQKWWDTIHPKLAEKTFEDVTPNDGETMQQARDRFGRSAFEAMTTGIRKNKLSFAAPDDGSSYIRPEFEGSFNIARKVSEGRLFYFKSPDDWSSYMKLYGKQQNFYQLMVDSLSGAGRKIGLMHFLGTNPTANFNMVVRSLEEKFRSDIDGVDKFQKDVTGKFLTHPNLHDVMGELDGSANIPVNQDMHEIAKTVRGFYNMLYLGFVAFTHATSLVSTVPAEARVQGISTLSSLGNVLKSLVPPSLKSADRADALAEAGAYADGVTRRAFNAFGHGKTIPGYVAAMEHRFHAMTGITFLFDNVKAGFREMLMNNLGRNVSKEFDALDPHISRILSQYGIGKDEWDLMRSVPTMTVADGKVYFGPTAAFSTDRGAVEQLLRSKGEIKPDATPDAISKAVDTKQQDMADRVMMWLSDSADHSVVTAGVRERAIMQGSTRPGTLQQELMQSLLQFKSWPLAAMHQIIGKQIFDSLSKTEIGLGIMGTIALSMIGGYMRMGIRDLFAGNEIRVPQGPGSGAKIALAALAQGGGLGIFGDMMFGEINRNGSHGLSAMGGPVFSDLDALTSIFYRWQQSMGTDSKHDFGVDMLDWARNHIPLQNLFYIKAATDYTLWFHLKEALHPGAWERMNRRMQKEQGRTMLGYQPGAGIPTYPFAIGNKHGFFPGH